MTQADHAAAFRALHVRGDPLRLYNVWDAGSALAVTAAGAGAVATGSLSLAAAHGYPDGERIPLDLVLTVAGRIAASVDVPVSIDIEGGYGVEPEIAARTVARVIEAGAIGVNFEDGIVGGEGLHGSDAQVARLEAIRATVPPWAFVNARTDLFLQAGPDRHEALVDEAIARATAYAEAGADGFFVPGLTSLDAIARIADAVVLPLNVMVLPALPALAQIAQAGAARLSWGPAPFRAFVAWLEREARIALVA